MFLLTRSKGLSELFPLPWRPTSVNFYHFDLFSKHGAKLNHAWLWYSLNGPLPKLGLVTFSHNQDNLHCFLFVEKFSESQDGMKPNLVLIDMGWSSFKLCVLISYIIQDGHHAWLCNFCKWFSRIISSFCYLIQLIFCNMFSEWLLFNANSAIFQLYHGENRLIFNEMMMVMVIWSSLMLRYYTVLHL